jgi:transposase
VFLDESSINCGMTRLYGRALKAERITDYVSDVRFERTSVISTIRLDGTQAPLMFQGTLNGEVFTIYVKDILAPTLKPGDIVVLDNLSSHKVKGALEPIYQRGATVLFLPPYSPDFNPIELSWSKMKAVLRKQKAKTYDDLVESMKLALNSITNTDISNWFKHCGYIANV